MNFRSVLTYLILLLALVGIFINGTMHGDDFHVFYTAGLRVRLGESIYRLSDGWLPYKYHPAIAVLFLSFTWLPEKIAMVLFNLLMLSCWIAAIRIWAKWLGYELNPKRVFLLFLLVANAMSAEFGYGQINGFLFLAITWIVDNLENRRSPVKCGLLMALLIAIKLNLGLILFYGLIKNLRTILGAAVGAVLLHLIVSLGFGVSIFSIDIYQEWVHVLLAQSSEQYYHHDAQSFMHFFHSLFGAYGTFAWASSLAMFLWGAFWLDRRDSPNRPVIGSYWLSGLYLFSPLAWWYQLPNMLPMAFYLLRQPLPKWKRGLIYTAFVVYALTTFNIFGQRGVNHLKQAQVFFLASLAILTLFIEFIIKNSNHRA